MFVVLINCINKFLKVKKTKKNEKISLNWCTPYPVLAVFNFYLLSIIKFNNQFKMRKLFELFSKQKYSKEENIKILRESLVE